MIRQITDAAGLDRMLTRLSHEIVERNDGAENLAVVGIRRRGVQVAERIVKKIGLAEGVKPDFGVLDVTLYRDDLLDGKSRSPSGTVIDFDVNGKVVVLCDDVLYTGRTVRAAISALLAVGRPSKIRFLTLVDRGHREFPFRSDYTGKNIPTSSAEKVCVRFMDTDGEEGIFLVGADG